MSSSVTRRLHVRVEGVGLACAPAKYFVEIGKGVRVGGGAAKPHPDDRARARGKVEREQAGDLGANPFWVYRGLVPAHHEFMKAILEKAAHILGAEQFRRIGLVVAEQERLRAFIVQGETAELVMLDAD